jgi:hypothetical protein
MTIAELLVKIGIVSDTADLEKIDKEMMLAWGGAKRLALGLAAIDTAMIALMKASINVAVGFTKFRIETGLSTDQLQRWQYAARLANVDSKDLTGAILSIQDAQAAIKLGEGNIAPWQLLGIDPRQDPFEVLEQIHQKIQEIGDPAVARHITVQMGISDDMFQFLSRADLGLDELNTKMMVTHQQEQDMMALNKQWQPFTYNLERAGMKFAHDIEPAFEQLLPMMEKFLDKFADFADWATSGTSGAKEFREGLVKLAEAALIAAPALTALLTLLASFKTITMSASAIEAIRLMMGGRAAAGGAAALEEGTATAGGEIVGMSTAAFASINAILTGVAALGLGVYDIIHVLNHPADPKNIEAATAEMQSEGLIPRHRTVKDLLEGIDGARGLPQLLAPDRVSAAGPGQPTKGGDTTVNHNVTVNVDATGAKDPQAVGDAVGGSVEDAIDAYKKREYAAAAAQAAVPNTGY